MVRDDRSDGAKGERVMVYHSCNGTVWYEAEQDGGKTLTQTQQLLLNLKCKQPTQVNAWVTIFNWTQQWLDLLDKLDNYQPQYQDWPLVRPQEPRRRREVKSENEWEKKGYQPWIIGWAYNNSVRVTVAPNATTQVNIPIKALEGLRTLSNKMKEHSGVDTSWYSDWLNVFGKYKSLIASVLIYIDVFAAIMVLCGCCCIPCIRSLTVKTIKRTLGPLPPGGQYMMIPQKDPQEAETAVALRESGIMARLGSVISHLGAENDRPWATRPAAVVARHGTGPRWLISATEVDRTRRRFGCDHISSEYGTKQQGRRPVMMYTLPERFGGRVLERGISRKDL
ncbi:uncharacterized protein LOC133506040 [Syngnathoides biaculeatus]|uniref:uncharacterized protein LOC133506040 n=1 Tax=Syngnathoides biaculeatus TaxID=300417 RepID=UPI002ADE10FF|nr:uncharacterized protein LOC133506040 [Syngnathoides biaculeatus]